MPSHRNDETILPTILEVIRDSASRLSRVGIPSDQAHVEARILLQHASGVSVEQLIARYPDQIDDRVAETIERLLVRREAREPLAYIIGETEFYGRKFKVDHRILIPRPETELLIDLCLQFVQHHHINSPDICDIGTGSGVIAVSLAKELIDARITATDISDDALAIAECNARYHHIASDRVRFMQDDINRSRLNGQFDIVVSNPPYIRTDTFDALQTEVRDWEPRLALDGGTEGMHVLHPLLRSLPNLLRKDSPCAAFIEIDPPIVERCLKTARSVMPNAYIEVHRYFGRLERVLCIISS